MPTREQALRQAEEQLKSDIAVDKATIEDKKNASLKADYDAQRAAECTERHDVEGAGGWDRESFVGMAPGGEGPFKAGEQAWPGMAIAELPDASSLRVAGARG